MKPFWISLAYLTALLTGVFLGRYSAAPSFSASPPGSAARPVGSGAPAKPQPAPNLITQLKQTPGIRKKTTLMLSHLAKGQNGTMHQLVEAAGNDFGQLLMLSDIALHTDPSGFIKAIIINAGTEGPQEAVANNFAEQWAKADFDAAFETCRSLPHPIGGWLGGTALGQFFGKDPTAALKLAAAYPGLNLTWADQQKLPATPENLALVRGLPPGFSKAAMIKAISANLSPDEAFALVLEDRHSGAQLGILKASMAMIEKDPQAAQEWVLVHPDHPATAQLSRSVGKHLIETSPTAAVEWATTHLSGSSRTRTLEEAAEALQETDPAAADAARALLPEAFKASGKP